MTATLEAEVDRPPTAWRVDKTINLPTAALVVSALITAITLFNGLRNDVDREREARMRLEASQAQSRIDQGQIRQELMQQQSQMRLELQQQLGEVKTEIKTELREMRNDIKANR